MPLPPYPSLGEQLPSSPEGSGLDSNMVESTRLSLQLFQQWCCMGCCSLTSPHYLGWAADSFVVFVVHVPCSLRVCAFPLGPGHLYCFCKLSHCSFPGNFSLRVYLLHFFFLLSLQSLELTSLSLFHHLASQIHSSF